MPSGEIEPPFFSLTECAQIAIQPRWSFHDLPWSTKPYTYIISLTLGVGMCHERRPDSDLLWILSLRVSGSFNHDAGIIMIYRGPLLGRDEGNRVRLNYLWGRKNEKTPRFASCSVAEIGAWGETKSGIHQLVHMPSGGIELLPLDVTSRLAGTLGWGDRHGLRGLLGSFFTSTNQLNLRVTWVVHHSTSTQLRAIMPSGGIETPPPESNYPCR